MVRKFVVVSFVPVLLALFAVFGYPGSVPVIQAGGTPGALVPMGDALGDVGQHYSQVDPSQLSRLGIYNPNGSSVTANVYFYADDGTGTAITTSCTIAANSGVEVRTDIVTQTVCSNLSAQPHGVYHGVVTSTGGNVAVANWVNNDLSTGNGLVSSAYEAVPASITNTTHYLYGVLVRGTPGNDWTDTEFVVQNPSTTTDAYVQFTLCESNGTTCWSNNSATVPKKGHRIFLLSQLAYQNNNGNLTEKSGSLSVKLTVTNSLPVATMTNLFRQSVPTTKTLPMAETGAKWMMSIGQQRVAGSGVIPRFYRESGDAAGGYSHAVKVQNLGASSTTVTVELRDANGNVPTNGTVSKSVGANAIAEFYSYEFNVSAGTYAARIYSNGSHNLAAWHWRSGSEGYYGDVWQPLSSSRKNYAPVVRSNIWSWATAVGYMTHSVVNYGGTLPPSMHYTYGGTYSTSGTMAEKGHGNSNTSSTPAAVTYGLGVAEDSWGYGYVNSMPVIYKSGSGDTRVAYNATWQTASTWYVPFAPAPVVQFGWSTSHETGHPDAAQFGFAGNPTVNGSPTWASDMNWYVWPRMHNATEWATARNNCLNAHYLLMDKGLTDVGGTYNSATRLEMIRNLAPSACAGRPLLLANEPNLTGDQGDMTHVEVARQVFVYRNWPGNLHSPAYGRIDSNWKGVHTGLGTNMHVSKTSGLTDPYYTDYVGLKDYYENDISVLGGIPFDSLAVHFYLYKPEVPDGGTMDSTRQAEIEEWKTEATTLGVPVQVTEYGMLPITDTLSSVYCPEQCIADRVDELSDEIKTNLGTTERQLMWFAFISGVAPGGGFNWTWPNAFVQSGGSKVLTNPVGVAWEADADNY